MSLESSSRRQPSRERSIEAPRDKPRVERGEHANLERPGAQFHPVARGWNAPVRSWAGSVVQRS